MSRQMSDIAFSLLLIGAAIGLWFVADNFPGFGLSSSIGADFWPKAILGTIGFLAALLFLQSFVEHRMVRGMPVEAVDAPSTDASLDRSYGRLLATAALVFAYFMSLEYFGFLVATIAFLYVAENISDYRNWIAKLVFPPAFTGTLLVFFTEILTLPLPRGTGIFYDISLLLY